MNSEKCKAIVCIVLTVTRHMGEARKTQRTAVGEHEIWVVAGEKYHVASLGKQAATALMNRGGRSMRQ